MSATDTIRRDRERLWASDPHCHWCGRITVLPEVAPANKGDRLPPNAATVDHLITARQGGKQGRSSGPVVLACWGCNEMRNNIEQKALVGKPLPALRSMIHRHPDEPVPEWKQRLAFMRERMAGLPE